MDMGHFQKGLLQRRHNIVDLNQGTDIHFDTPHQVGDIAIFVGLMSAALFKPRTGARDPELLPRRTPHWAGFWHRCRQPKRSEEYPAFPIPHEALQ